MLEHELELFWRKKNWPPFFPLIHHDIANEIPKQRVMYVAFTTWLGIVACLFWNIIAVTTAWVKGEVAFWLQLIFEVIMLWLGCSTVLDSACSVSNQCLASGLFSKYTCTSREVVKLLK